jgi:hypothetical protein
MVTLAMAISGCSASRPSTLRSYLGVRSEPVIPTFEIITTVASSEAGADGDYSLESTLDHIRPWVDAARVAGLYVVLDLQPGHADFLTQAMRYEELLAQPHVGLALDPEWRLAPGERHLRDIGQVSADEVNRVSAWLADLTRRNHLPQKLLLLHQFRLDMLPDRAQILVPPELALVVQMAHRKSSSRRGGRSPPAARQEFSSAGRTSMTRTHPSAPRPTPLRSPRRRCTSRTSSTIMSRTLVQRLSTRTRGFGGPRCTSSR